MRGGAELRVCVGGVVAIVGDVACCRSGRVTTEPLDLGVATGADVPTLAKGRLVSRGRPERSWGG